MKNFNTNYVYEYQYNTFINEGKLGDAIKNFWNWLMGNKTESKLLPSESDFVESELEKVYTASDGKYGFGPANLSEVKDILEKNTIRDTNKTFFEKTAKFIEDAGDEAKNKKWILGAFKTKTMDNANIIAVICCYDNRDDVSQNAAKINFIDVQKTSGAKKTFGPKPLRDLLSFIMNIVSKDPNGYPCHHVCLYDKTDKTFIKSLKDYPGDFDITDISKNKKSGIKVTKE